MYNMSADISTIEMLVISLTPSHLPIPPPQTSLETVTPY